MVITLHTNNSCTPGQRFDLTDTKKSEKIPFYDPEQLLEKTRKIYTFKKTRKQREKGSFKGELERGEYEMGTRERHNSGILHVS